MDDSVTIMVFVKHCNNTDTATPGTSIESTLKEASTGSSVLMFYLDGKFFTANVQHCVS